MADSVLVGQARATLPPDADWAVRQRSRRSDTSQGLAVAGVEIRSGVHVGEVERRGGDIGGIAVHLAARVMDAAGPGEDLVSEVDPPLMAGSGTEFAERGERDLKGIPGTWRLLEAKV